MTRHEDIKTVIYKNNFKKHKKLSGKIISFHKKKFRKATIMIYIYNKNKSNKYNDKY